MTYRAICSVLILFAATLMSAQSMPPAIGRGLPPNANANPDTRDPMMSIGAITGSVLTVDGHPVANSRVDLRSQDGTNLVATVYSNAEGNFQMEHVPPGIYRLEATIGVRQANENVEVRGPQSWVTLRMPNADSSPAGGRNSVSINQMQVPENARKQYTKATEAMDKGKLDEARRYTDKALTADPNYAEALTLSGILDLQQQNLPAACAALEKAVQQDSDSAMAYIVLGSAYNSLNRFDDALRVLDRGLALAPNSWQGHFERARSLERKQQWAASLQELTKAAPLLPKDFPVLHLVKANDLIGLKAYPEAQAELQLYLQKAPNGAGADEARRVLQNVQTLTATAQK